MTDKTTAEREAFEAWHAATYPQDLMRRNDTYENAHVRCRWQGFQSGRASLPGAQEAAAAKLKALRASIAGDCYLGDLEELELIDAILAAPQPALSAGWQPIETKPDDADEIFAYGKFWYYKGISGWKEEWDKSHHTACGFGACMASFRHGNWQTGTVAGFTPTHWMPIPPSPSMDGESNGK